MEQQTQNTYRMTVDSSGRIVLPVEARQRHCIREGDVVVGFDDASGLTIRTLDEVLAQSRDFFKTLAPEGALLSDQINADRRVESERD